MNNKKKFNQICKDIKSIKIQGAENIAKKAFYAYKLVPGKASATKLVSLRSTEPMLQNILKIADKISYQELLDKLNNNQQTINEKVCSLIKNNSVVYTHCHSSSVIKALIYSKKKGKRFVVYNTETRPLFQGRKTAKELARAGIKVTMFVDSAAKIALTKSQDKEEKTRSVDIIFFGADAITKKGVVNKVGSGMFAEIAKSNKIPVYIVSDSLKFSNKVKMEQRNPSEVWKTKSKIKIVDPAFELIERQNITGIVSELGVLSYNDFLKRN
ncbi:Ribose 1,5-bisphosphate isomerase [uncultured archaeon]|nr:Ribose 1,5-bisphosphate isomerase [uncultured archaeon]